MEEVCLNVLPMLCMRPELELNPPVVSSDNGYVH